MFQTIAAPSRDKKTQETILDFFVGLNTLTHGKILHPEMLNKATKGEPLNTQRMGINLNELPTLTYQIVAFEKDSNPWDIPTNTVRICGKLQKKKKAFTPLKPTQSKHAESPAWEIVVFRNKKALKDKEKTPYALLKPATFQIDDRCIRDEDGQAPLLKFKNDPASMEVNKIIKIKEDVKGIWIEGKIDEYTKKLCPVKPLKQYQLMEKYTTPKSKSFSKKKPKK